MSFNIDINVGRNAIQTVSISFFRFDRAAARIWAFTQMGIARLDMPKTPGIGFWKLCGSGVGEGFTPIPNLGVWAILATWPDEETARSSIASGSVFSRFRLKAAESWTVLLQAVSSRGHWSGQEPFTVVDDRKTEALAVLTRATIKPKAAFRFWRRVPNISDVIGKDQNVLFKIGIGEVPWLHQVTFSIWPNLRGMVEFARKDGPHAKAIKAVRDGNWFREELYARFQVVGSIGSWEGSDPLQPLSIKAAS